jgi:anti-sigma B factor antagonist
VGLDVNTSRLEPGVVVLLLEGSITSGAEVRLDDVFIEDLLQQGERRLILDLTGIEHMDSTGMHLMYTCFSRAQEAGAELRFVSSNARISRIFKITRLDEVLPFYPTVEAARRSFTPNPSATS